MSLTERPQLFIGGRWVDSKGGRKVDVHNPATGAYVGSTVLASTADIDAAVASARASFNSGVWANTPPEERAAVLHRAADLLEERAPELAKLITRNWAAPSGSVSAPTSPTPSATCATRHLPKTRLRRAPQRRHQHQPVTQVPAGRCRHHPGTGR